MTHSQEPVTGTLLLGRCTLPPSDAPSDSVDSFSGHVCKQSKQQCSTCSQTHNTLGPVTRRSSRLCMWVIKQCTACVLWCCELHAIRVWSEGGGTPCVGFSSSQHTPLATSQCTEPCVRAYRCPSRHSPLRPPAPLLQSSLQAVQDTRSEAVTSQATTQCYCC